MATTSNSTTDRVFYVSLILKAADSALEIFGGLLALLIDPSKLVHVAQAVTQHELASDPHSFVANHILKSSHDFANSGRTFAAVYLLSHGFVKIFVIVAIFKQKLWAYPALMAVLGVFVIYQVYRLTQHFTAGLLFLTVFDLIIIGLTWREYQKHKTRLA